MGDTDRNDSERLVSQDILDDLIKEVDDLDIDSSETGESKDLDLVSPEDIENLLRNASGDLDYSQDDSELEMISQEEIEALMSGEELSGESLEEQTDNDSLISQDDIDALLGGAFSGEKTEEAKSEEDNGEEESETLISQDDIDALLNGAAFDTGIEEDSNAGEPESTTILQDDIDQLMKGSTEDIISKDDIANFLADDGLEETSSPDGFDAEMGEMLVSQEDIDNLLNADDIEDEIEKVADQVILEQKEEADKVDEKTGIRKWLGSKITIACAVSFVLIIIIGVGVSFFFRAPEEKFVETEVIEKKAEQAAPEIEKEIPENIVPAEEVVVVVELKDFVVPAPLTMKDISYISLDLSIEIVDVTSNPIKGYEPFFRNIIYEVLNKALLLENESRIIESDLVLMIKTALDGALSEGSIGKISLLAFNLT